MIYGNISTELLLLADELEPEQINRIKEEFELEDDLSEYEIMQPEVEWLIEQGLLDDEAIELYKEESVDRIILVLK